MLKRPSLDDLGQFVLEHAEEFLSALADADRDESRYIETDDGPKPRYGKLTLEFLEALGRDPSDELAWLDAEANKIN